MITGSAIENSPCVILARIRNAEGVYVEAADVLQITCRIYDAYNETLIESIDIEPDDVLYSDMQTDRRWTRDDTGYNFAHTIPGTALPEGNTRYRIEYKIEPASGETDPGDPMYIIAEITTTAILSA